MLKFSCSILKSDYFIVNISLNPVALLLENFEKIEENQQINHDHLFSQCSLFVPKIFIAIVQTKMDTQIIMKFALVRFENTAFNG
jgi:hypothetical protein